MDVVDMVARTLVATVVMDLVAMVAMDTITDMVDMATDSIEVSSSIKQHFLRWQWHPDFNISQILFCRSDSLFGVSALSFKTAAFCNPSYMPLS